jgi:hypothetical protein
MVKRFHGIARRSTGCVSAAMCLVVMGGRSAVAQGDLFAQQRDAEATKNASTGFSISFADDRRAFRPGEAIALVFTFSRQYVSPFNYEHCHGLGVADAVLDHSDGTADPQADLWNNGILSPECGLLSGVRGGIVGGDVKVEIPPIEFAVYLNQAVRFDRPGTYRVYVRSRHRFLGNRGDELLPPLISNILAFTIVGRDRAWETRTLEEATRVVNFSSDAAARTGAARSISYLGTAEVIEEMARRLYGNSSRDGLSDRDSVLNSHWLRGLYGAPERAVVVARMERELDQAERYTPPWYVSQLSLLDLTRRLDSRPIERSAYDSRVRSYSTRHMAALQEAGGLQTDLEQTFAVTAQHEGMVGSYGLASGFAEFPDDVEAAFATLPPIQQRVLLNTKRNWTVLREPAFVPMLRRLASGTNRQGPQDIALRLLYDLAPLEGRQIVLRELAKRDSAVGISGLRMLPDQPLPRLDNALVGSLEKARTAEEYGQAMERIERFATPHMFTRVRRVYERFEGARGCMLAPASLAYFFRVAPTYARTEIGSVMKEVNEGDRCETGVLPAIAERRMVPALEETAIRHLADANGWVVADAAHMLEQYGSAGAEAPLWQALERWHERWEDQQAKLETDQRNREMPWEEAIERDLTRALMKGTGWLLNESSARRLTSLCVTDRCKEGIDQEFQHPEPNPNITVEPAALPHGEPTFFVHEHTLVQLLSRDALQAWLSLHSEGTTFTWQESGWAFADVVWLPGEASRFFEETRSFVERRGMTLMRRR